jgi:NAD+ synthase (glutamine-hydrolysing)
MPIRVALGQTDCTLGDVDANVRSALRMANQAAEAGAQLILFPEMSLTGYFLGHRVFNVALRLDDHRLKPLMDASHRISMAIGLPVEEPGPRFYNAALYLEAGQVKHVHRKIYLPTFGAFNDARYFSPGEKMAGFDTRFGRMAMLICEDMWHPALAYLASQDGADYLLGLIASPAGGVDTAFDPRAGYQAIHQAYAITLTCFVLACNRAGAEDGYRYWGGSEVVGPDGTCLAQAEGSHEQLVLADLEPGVLRRQRIRLPTLREDRPDLVLRELQRILASR